MRRRSDREELYAVFNYSHEVELLDECLKVLLPTHDIWFHFDYNGTLEDIEVWPND